MTRFEEAVGEILKGISKVIRQIDPDQVEGVIQALLKSRSEDKRVLIVGAGRSGLVGRAFAMRLMHLGFNVYVLGETINPAVGEDDLVIVISGSGSTALPVTVAGIAKKLGVNVLAITSNPDSQLGRAADHIMRVPGRSTVALEEEYHSRQLLGEHESLTPMGTLFENSCMILLDSLIAELMGQLGMSEEEMRRRHAAIE